MPNIRKKIFEKLWHKDRSCHSDLLSCIQRRKKQSGREDSSMKGFLIHPSRDAHQRCGKGR